MIINNNDFSDVIFKYFVANFVNLFFKTHVFFPDTFLEPNKVLAEPERREVELEALGEPLHVGDHAELGRDQTETR